MNSLTLNLIELLLSLLALALFLYKFYIEYFRWRGAWIVTGRQSRKITKHDKTTIAVDKPFDADSNSVFIIKD